MRLPWLSLMFCCLGSMGLSLIVIGQYHMFDILSKREEQLKMEAQKLDNHYMNQEVTKMTMDKLLAQKMKVLQDLEAAAAKLGQGLEAKKKDVNICQAEKTTITDEFNSIEMEQNKTEASFKTESSAWEQKINNLKEQLKAYSPVCGYVKNNTLALKLCGS